MFKSAKEFLDEEIKEYKNVGEQYQHLDKSAKGIADLFQTLKNLLTANPELNHLQMQEIRNHMGQIVRSPAENQFNSLFIVATYLNNCQVDKSDCIQGTDFGLDRITIPTRG